MPNLILDIQKELRGILRDLGEANHFELGDFVSYLGSSDCISTLCEEGDLQVSGQYGKIIGGFFEGDCGERSDSPLFNIRLVEGRVVQAWPEELIKVFTPRK